MEHSRLGKSANIQFKYLRFIRIQRHTVFRRRRRRYHRNQGTHLHQLQLQSLKRLSEFDDLRFTLEAFICVETHTIRI